MNKCPVTAIVAVMLLAVSTAAAQKTPAPRILYADLPTPADIMAEYADSSSVVADAKRLAILDAERRFQSTILPGRRSMPDAIPSFSEKPNLSKVSQRRGPRRSCTANDLRRLARKSQCVVSV